VTARGEDALRFCDNFLTASLSRLGPGGGTEAFVLDAKGAVLAHVHAFRVADGVWLDAEGGREAGGRLQRHLEHYHIRERLDLVDRSDAFRHVVLVGAPAGGPATTWLHSMDGVMQAVVPWSGNRAILVAVPAARFEEVVERLEDEGFGRGDPHAWERLRIGHGVPAVEDIADRTLAQELARNERAIAFDKGCYLGQETVARLDALGHVNRRLVRLVVSGASPPPRGAACLLDAAPIPGEAVGGPVRVGAVGSACAGEAPGESWALAMLTVGAADARGGLSVDGRPAWIVPMSDGGTTR
jgi:folate-binding protein YgfZ